MCSVKSKDEYSWIERPYKLGKKPKGLYRQEFLSAAVGLTGNGRINGVFFQENVWVFRQDKIGAVITS